MEYLVPVLIVVVLAAILLGYARNASRAKRTGQAADAAQQAHPAPTTPLKSSRYLFLYWPNDENVERMEIEETIGEVLGEDGEVSGGGSGTDLVNLDIEIYDGERSESIQRILNQAVAADLPSGAYWKWEFDNDPLPVHD